MNTPIQCLGTEQSNALYIKRDDLIPFSFGGNKARKAFLFFREIDAGDYDTVVTYGSSHSNHCRVVANMAAQRGMECRIISPLEVSDPTFNSRMMSLFGAQIHSVPVEQVHDTIEETMAALRRSGKKPFFIQGGGHGNTGTEAYVQCYEEIRSFEASHQIAFDSIFFASGTGTTQAGLVCGQLLHREARQIVGVSIARRNPRGRNVVIDSVKDYLCEKGMEVDDAAIDRMVNFIDDYVGDGYASDDPEISAVIREMMCRHGIAMDSTYTAKAFLGMRKYLQKNKIENQRILFIHTGGTPLYFDDISKMEL